MDNYSGFIYDPDPYAVAELSAEYFEVIKMAENWYFCSST